MKKFRIALIVLAIAMSGCAQIIQERLSSARGSIENEREQSVRAGVSAKRILLLADLVEQNELIKSASERFNASLYNTLSGYGYTVKQFQPQSVAERDQYLMKVEADLARDTGLLVVRLVPKSIKGYSTLNNPSIKVPKNMEFTVHAFVGTLKSPAYTYSGSWTYDSDFYFNGLTVPVTEHLIKADYLAKKTN